MSSAPEPTADLGHADVRDPADTLGAQAAMARIAQAMFGEGELVRVGRYAIVEHIARGGFGDVYSAFDPKLSRKVALKLLRTDPEDPEQHRRVLREAQALAQVAHPNVVAVYDVGSVGGVDGSDVYLAMEFVEGQSLHAWAKDERRPWREVLAACIAAARGLAAVHDAGLVHHDFKPSNVLIGRDGRVRVVDFGLARIGRGMLPPADHAGLRAQLNRQLGGDDTLGAALTPAGKIHGTPAYMAPEQHTGGLTDARTDVYSLCATAWEALHGRRPFPGTDPAKLLAAKQARTFAPGDPAHPVPAWVDKVLRWGMAADPGDRPASVAGVIAALQRDPARRIRRIAIAVAAVAAMVGAAWFWWPTAPTPGFVEQTTVQARAAAAKAHFLYPPPDDPDAPTAYRVVLTLEAEGSGSAQRAATSLRQEFADTLVRLGDRYWDAPGGRAFAVDYYGQARVFDVDNERAKSRALMTRGQLAVLRRQADVGDFEPAQLQAAEPLIALAEPDDEARRTKVGRLRRPGTVTRADLARIVGTRDPGEEVAPKPVPVASRSSAAPSPTVVPREDSSASNPEVETSRARPAPDKPPRRDRPTAKAEVEAGYAALRKLKWSKAEQAFRRALEADPDLARAHFGLAQAAFQRGAYRKARRHAQAAIDRGPKVAAYRLWLGDANYRLERHDDARRAYTKAQSLGSTKAAARLEKLDRRLGRAPSQPK